MAAVPAAGGRFIPGPLPGFTQGHAGSGLGGWTGGRGVTSPWSSDTQNKGEGGEADKEGVREAAKEPRE